MGKDRVFVTRDLNMYSIKYVGFDMDYTLAGKFFFFYYFGCNLVKKKQLFLHLSRKKNLNVNLYLLIVSCGYLFLLKWLDESFIFVSYYYRLLFFVFLRFQYIF